MCLAVRPRYTGSLAMSYDEVLPREAHTWRPGPMASRPYTTYVSPSGQVGIQGQVIGLIQSVEQKLHIVISYVWSLYWQCKQIFGIFAHGRLTKATFPVIGFDHPFLKSLQNYMNCLYLYI